MALHFSIAHDNVSFWCIRNLNFHTHIQTATSSNSDAISLRSGFHRHDRRVHLRAKIL
jgi:hypothetical protein